MLLLFVIKRNEFSFGFNLFPPLDRHLDSPAEPPPATASYVTPGSHSSGRPCFAQRFATFAALLRASPSLSHCSEGQPAKR